MMWCDMKTIWLVTQVLQLLRMYMTALDNIISNGLTIEACHRSNPSMTTLALLAITFTVRVI